MNGKKVTWQEYVKSPEYLLLATYRCIGVPKCCKRGEIWIG